MFGKQTTLANVSAAFPTIDPTRQVVTTFVTDAKGVVITSVSTVPLPSVTLGVPPGWSSAVGLVDGVHVVPLLVVIVGFVHFFLDNFAFFRYGYLI